MKFQKILLRNIGAYYGHHNEIDFTTSPEQNVILIGGKNGAGKTTLLESIRVALFGCIAYGFMTENDAYFNRIQSLFNRKAINENNSYYQVILNYESVENFLSVNYSISRTWNIKNKKIKETFTVKRDGRLFNERETDNYQNRIREEIPPRLFELCLFDGEEISRVVTDGRVSEYLSEASKILFNLDLFSSLDKDLGQFKNAHNANLEQSLDTSKKEMLEEELLGQQQEVQSLSNQINEYNQTIDNYKEQLSLKKRDFEMHGGIQKEAREKMILELSRLESIRKKNQDQIKGFIADLLPLYLVRDLVYETNSQMNDERNIETFEQVSRVFTENKITQIISQLSEENNLNVNSQFNKMLYDKIISEFAPDHKQVIHRASFSQKTELAALQLSLEKTSVQIYISMYEENAILLDRIQEIKRKLDTNDNSSEFKLLLDDIELLTQNIEQTRAIIEQKQAEELLITEQIKITQSAIETENAQLSQHRKSATSLILAEKVLLVSRRFQEIQLRKKLDQVQNEAIKMIQRLFRKKDYITRIYISHETFDLKLFHQHEPINKERLSAGEKEMLMLSIIWAMFKSTGWKLPLVFDTLLGRLDQDHKRELITNFLPRCGDQVIVLATDSEITSSQFKDLKHHLSRFYTLEFNVSSSAIDINQNHYFDIYDLELA